MYDIDLKVDEQFEKMLRELQELWEAFLQAFSKQFQNSKSVYEEQIELTIAALKFRELELDQEIYEIEKQISSYEDKNEISDSIVERLEQISHEKDKIKEIVYPLNTSLKEFKNEGISRELLNNVETPIKKAIDYFAENNNRSYLNYTGEELATKLEKFFKLPTKVMVKHVENIEADVKNSAQDIEILEDFKNDNGPYLLDTKLATFEEMAEDKIVFDSPVINNINTIFEPFRNKDIMDKANTAEIAFLCIFAHKLDTLCKSSDKLKEIGAEVIVDTDSSLKIDKDIVQDFYTSPKNLNVSSEIEISEVVEVEASEEVSIQRKMEI